MDTLDKLTNKFRDQERLVTLLHRIVHHAESRRELEDTEDGVALLAIAEDALIRFYERHEMLDRLYRPSKKEIKLLAQQGKPPPGTELRKLD